MSEQKEILKFDVMASVNSFDGGGDGAYGLIGEGQTLDEILANLREQLSHLHESLVSRNNYVPCYLAIAIGPAGSYERLPLDPEPSIPGATGGMLRGEQLWTNKAEAQSKSDYKCPTVGDVLKSDDQARNQAHGDAEV